MNDDRIFERIDEYIEEAEDCARRAEDSFDDTVTAAREAYDSADTAKDKLTEIENALSDLKDELQQARQQAEANQGIDVDEARCFILNTVQDIESIDLTITKIKQRCQSQAADWGIEIQARDVFGG